MAICNTAVFRLKRRDLLFTLFSLHYCTALQSFVSADLIVQPLWNTTQNISQPCAIDDSEDGMVRFHGDAKQMCSLQISLPNRSAVWIQTWAGNPDSYSLHIEYNPDTMLCPEAYGVIQVNSGYECSIALQPPELEIHLHGNTSVLISEVAVQNVTQQECSLVGTVNEEPQVSPTTNQCSVKGYDRTMSCHDQSSTWCTIYFPYNCNTTVADREVLLQCKDYNDKYYSEKTLVLYNTNIEGLDLSLDNIHVIQVNAFQSIHSIKTIYLGGNALVTIEVGVFAGLRNLLFLSLSYNALLTLPVGMFQDLGSLLDLYLAGNEMIVLQTGVFVGLKSLTTLELGANKLQILGPGLLHDLISLRELYLYNNELISLHAHIFKGLSNLKTIDLYSNNIKVMQPDLFHDLQYLNYIDLYGNRLQRVDVNLFRGLNELATLYLNKNALSELETDTFRDLGNLKALSLADNQLKRLESDALKYQSKLTFLDLSGNKLMRVPDIKNLSHLSFLNLKDNELIRVSKEDFVSLAEGVELYASQQEICECFVPFDVLCNAADPRSPYLTCDRLLSDSVLMALMWIIGFNAICGNLFVLVWRKTKEKQITVQSRLLANLAMSDLLMGVYMITLASADNYFGKYFPMHGETWRTGITCRVAGALSIVSSEASVFFVTLISIDRFVNMKYPLSTLKLRRKSATVMAVLIWIVSLAIGIVPSALAGVNDAFYDNSHVCIGLPLAKMEYYTTEKSSKFICPENSLFCFYLDSYQSKSQGLKNGMYFSTAVFLGLNCICYLVIFGCYTEIIRAVLKSQRSAGVNKEMRDQMRLTGKVTAIVATDFFCWFPIIILGILVQMEVVTLPPSVFAWSVTFVLPINSAINPYLYTISHAFSTYRKTRQSTKRSRASQMQSVSIVSNPTQDSKL